MSVYDALFFAAVVIIVAALEHWYGQYRRRER